MSSHPDEHLEIERMLFFSDAVFAIAITLLALELKVPAQSVVTSENQLGQTLLGMLLVVIGFAWSFLLIGQTWIEHHRIGKFLTGTDRGLLWWNLFLLFFVALMPFTTALISEYFVSPIATIIYAAGFSGLSLCKVGLWRHAQSKGLIKGDRAETHEIGRRIWASPLVSLSVVLLAWVGVPYAYFGFLLIPVVARILSRGLR